MIQRMADAARAQSSSTSYSRAVELLRADGHHRGPDRRAAGKDRPVAVDVLPR